jgi:hypothetical protein
MTAFNFIEDRNASNITSRTSRMAVTAPRMGAARVAGSIVCVWSSKGAVLYVPDSIKLKPGERASHNCLLQPIKALATKPVLLHDTKGSALETQGMKNHLHVPTRTANTNASSFRVLCTLFFAVSICLLLFVCDSFRNEVHPTVTCE